MKLFLKSSITVATVIPMVLFIVMLLVSHFFFEPANLYYEIWWLDIPMHMFGGFLIGLALTPIIFKQKITYTYHMLIFIFFIGATGWEMWEFETGRTAHSLFGLLDTVKDYIDGIIGVTCGYLYRKNYGNF